MHHRLHHTDAGERNHTHLKGTAGPGSCRKSTMSATQMSHIHYSLNFFFFLYISVSTSKRRIRGGSGPNQRGGPISGVTCALSQLTGLYDFPECM